MANLKSVYPAHPFFGLCPAPESRRAAAPKGSSWAFNRMLEIQKSVCVLHTKYVWIPVPFSQTTACMCVKLCVRVSIYQSIYLSIYALWATINSLGRNEWWGAGVCLRAWTNLFIHRLVLYMYTIHDSGNYVPRIFSPTENIYEVLFLRHHSG